MGSRLPGAGYAAPAAGFVATALLLGWLAQQPGFYADKLVVAAFGAGCVWLLWWRTGRTNRLVARFVSALEHRDLTQTFHPPVRGAGFDELGHALDDALRRLRDERLTGAAENRFAAALVDEAPTPLLAVDEGGQVHLANKAARRLFRECDGRPADAFARYGPDLARALAEAQPGERQVGRVRWNGLLQRAVLAAAVADRQGTRWRIVSVQIIQGELDAAEMATQSDLVRVLTHEIMNSLTPVTSLAASAERLLAEVGASDAQALEEARMAVGALSRRAMGIRDFVDAYRAFTETPAVRISPFDAAPWLADLVRAFAASPAAGGVRIVADPPAAGMRIDGDAGLLGQVLLNLLKNAAQAAAGAPAPTVAVSIAANEAGRSVLAVSDNGPGVPPGLEEEVFLPFFTTKGDGSGVGLSFARQVVLLHGGAIGLARPELGGATFQVVL